MFHRRVVIGLAGILAGSVSLTAADVVLISGKKSSGTVVAVDAKEVSVKSTDGVVARYPVKELMVIDLGPKPASLTPATVRDQIELVDGSVIVGTDFGIKNKTAVLKPLTGPNGAKPPKWELPLTTLLSYLRGAEDAERRQAWKQLVAGRGKRDLFVISQSSGLNPLAGTVIEGNEEGDRITFELETGGQRSLPLSRASGGLVFNQPPRAVIPPTVCKVHDLFGNVLYAQAIDLTGSTAVVTTVSGATVRYPDLGGLAKLDFSQGNIAYLADLDPTLDARPETFGDPTYNIRRDTEPDGDQPTLDGVAYDRALRIAPETIAVYPIGADYREFKTILGIDDRRPPDAAVKLTIEADGRPVYSDTVSRKNKPTPLTIDVKNVNELRISVQPIGLYSVDFVVLADAKVQK